MKILSVMDPSFQNYGQVLGGYDVKELLATLDKVTPLPDGVVKASCGLQIFLLMI